MSGGPLDAWDQAEKQLWGGSISMGQEVGSGVTFHPENIFHLLSITYEWLQYH